MNAKFETSLGWVKGIIFEDTFNVLEGYVFLEKLYVIAGNKESFEVRDNWVKIELDDPYYGEPEYKLIKSPVK